MNWVYGFAVAVLLLGVIAEVARRLYRRHVIAGGEVGALGVGRFVALVLILETAGALSFLISSAVFVQSQSNGSQLTQVSAAVQRLNALLDQGVRLQTSSTQYQLEITNEINYICAISTEVAAQGHLPPAPPDLCSTKP